MTEYDLDRDAQALEPHFTKHMSAMTCEGLHSKSDIACELAYRDREIRRLREQLADAERVIRVVENYGSWRYALKQYRKKYGGGDE